jgi:hypothetical protein
MRLGPIFHASFALLLIIGPLDTHRHNMFFSTAESIWGLFCSIYIYNTYLCISVWSIRLANTYKNTRRWWPCQKAEINGVTFPTSFSSCLPQRPTDDNVPLHCHPKGAVDGPGLGGEAQGIDPRSDVGEHLGVVPAKELVLCVPIDGRQAAITIFCGLHKLSTRDIRRRRRQLLSSTRFEERDKFIIQYMASECTEKFENAPGIKREGEREREKFVLTI